MNALEYNLLDASEREQRDVAFQLALKDPVFAANFDKIKAFYRDGQLTLADIGGFSQTELNGAYVCACQSVDRDQCLEALQVLGALILVNPRDHRYYQLAAIGLQRLDRCDLADAFYTMALAYEPEDAISLMYAGETKIQMGDITAGIEHLRRGIAYGAANPLLKEYVHRARLIVDAYQCLPHQN